MKKEKAKPKKKKAANKEFKQGMAAGIDLAEKGKLKKRKK